MAMTNASETVHGGSVHHGKLADLSRLDKDLDGPVYRCLTHGRQLFAERLRCKAFMFMLQELGYRLPRSSRPIASVLQTAIRLWRGVSNPVLIHGLNHKLTCQHQILPLWSRFSSSSVTEPCRLEATCICRCRLLTVKWAARLVSGAIGSCLPLETFAQLPLYTEIPHFSSPWAKPMGVGKRGWGALV